MRGLGGAARVAHASEGAACFTHMYDYRIASHACLTCDASLYAPVSVPRTHVYIPQGPPYESHHHRHSQSPCSQSKKKKIHLWINTGHVPHEGIVTVRGRSLDGLKSVSKKKPVEELSVTLEFMPSEAVEALPAEASQSSSGPTTSQLPEVKLVAEHGEAGEHRDSLSKEPCFSISHSQMSSTTEPNDLKE